MPKVPQAPKPKTIQMEEGHYALAWMWYRGLRHYLGKWRNDQWRYAKKRYQILYPQPEEGYTCAICKNIIPPEVAPRHHTYSVPAYGLTFDHIIPIDAILFGPTYHDPWLMFSINNMQPAHALCNVQKGADYPISSVYA